MVNLRQSISTLRKKGKDAVSMPSPTTKFRKSAGSLTPTSKRMSTLAMFKSKTDEGNTTEFDSDDLASHIGEIKMSSPVLVKSPNNSRRTTSLSNFTVEEKEEEKEVDLARKTDLKLQERREQRRRRQEELQKQLQLKLQNSTDSTNPSIDELSDFPGALPLMGSDDVVVKPRVSGGRKSAAVRNRRAEESDLPTRESRLSDQRKSSSPGRRMSRRPKPLEGEEQQNDGIRPFMPLQKELSGETIPEIDEDEKMPGRTPRERRKGKRKGDSEEFQVSPSPLGDQKVFDGQKLGLSSQRRERRKTDIALGQRKTLFPKGTGDFSQSSSPATPSNNYRSSARNQTDTGGRQRQSMRPRLTADFAATVDLETSTRSSLDSSMRSTGRATGLDSSLRSTGWKPKIRGSWDEGVEQPGLSIQSEHRTAASRRKRRDKMEEHNNSLLLHTSEHGHTGARTAKRNTINAGVGRRKRVDNSSSPQSDTRRRSRESETMRTNRSLDDDLIHTNLQKSTHRKEKSNGVRFDVKDDSHRNTRDKNEGERRKSSKTSENPKAKVDREKMLSPRPPTLKKLSLKSMSTKSPRGENLEGPTPLPVWDDEYGANADNSIKTQFVDEVQNDEGNRSSKETSDVNALTAMEDASESQHDFDYQEPSRNRVPDVESGEDWLEPIVVDTRDKEGKIESAALLQQNSGDAVGDVAKAKPPKKSRKSKNLSLEKNQDGIVDENSTSSSGGYMSSSSTETPEIPMEVPVADVDFSKRVSALNPDGHSSESSDEYTSAGSSDSDDSGDSSTSSESSSESAEAGVVPAVVSFQGSSEDLDDISSCASPGPGSENGEKLDGEDRKTSRSGKPTTISAQDDQVLPASLMEKVPFESNTEAPDTNGNVKEAQVGKEEDIPPPPPHGPAEDGRPKYADLFQEESDDGTFDDIFSNEIGALEGTLQNMGDLLLTPAPPGMTTKKSLPDVPPTTNDLGDGLVAKQDAQPNLEATTSPLAAVDNSEKAPSQPTESKNESDGHVQLQSTDYQFLMDILRLIASPSNEQQTMMESNPTMSKNAMIAAAKQENLNRQQLATKVSLLESQLSTLQKDLEKQQLETGAHRMQVATQDLTILEYKDSVESLTRKCESLEKGTGAITLKCREQEEEGFKMKESLEETNKLIKEQQMFMNAQQRQMQTMETKIAALQESRDREQSKMIMQNEKLREIIQIQKDTILKALGKRGETEVFDA
ncbi:unnamed protein product [Cylindrotheca closterium]|uniref:Uncharacterized protein n=1 Tax=Cylindrotheca closterium TaxID=2856 RepID=A0AAD2FYH8_9STRA|nr:unnamed protein product [Cylindrotheca closterium]